MLRELSVIKSFQLRINFESHRWIFSHRRYSVRKGVLRKFAKFTEKHLCQSLFFKEVAGLRSAILLKKDSDIVVFL